jgi:hypothetical protein
LCSSFFFYTSGMNGVNLFLYLLEKVLLDSIFNQDVYSLKESQYHSQMV